MRLDARHATRCFAWTVSASLRGVRELDLHHGFGNKRVIFAQDTFATLATNCKCNAAVSIVHGSTRVYT